MSAGRYLARERGAFSRESEQPKAPALDIAQPGALRTNRVIATLGGKPIPPSSITFSEGRVRIDVPMPEEATGLTVYRVG